MRKITKKNYLMKRVESHQKEELEELLRRLYVDEELPVKQIAELLRISYATAWNWLALAGIYSRRLRIL